MRFGQCLSGIIAAVAAALVLTLASGVVVAQPIEQREVSFVAPVSTRYVVLTANHYRLLEQTELCVEEGRFHRCLLDRNRQWRLRVNSVGIGRAFDLRYNVNGNARLYYTCDRTFGEYHRVDLNRKLVDGESYPIICPTDEEKAEEA